MPIAVSNNIGTPITIQSIVVHGDFQIVQNPCPAPGQQLLGFFGCALQIVFTPTATGARTGDITVMASDEPFPHIAQITGTGVPDFSLGATSGTTSVTVSAGQPAIYNLQLTSIGGFTGTVAFTSSGAPKGAVCSVSPNPVILSGNTAPFTVTISTTAFSAKAFDRGARGATFVASMLLPWIFALMVTPLPVALPTKRRSKVKAVVGSILLLTCLISCGGGGGVNLPPVNSVTPPGTYPITLTATSGATTHTMTLSLTVQ